MINRSGQHFKQYNFLGVRVDAVDENDIFDFISNCEDRGLILHTNIYGLNIAFELDWYRHFLNSADIVFCDGAGIQLTGKLMGYEIPARITYAEWMWKLAAYAEKEKLSLYLLGAGEGVAEKASKNLVGQYNDLKIAGTHHGYFEKSGGSHENEMVISKINEVKPDILVVGFGMPIQEQWLMENWEKLEVRIGLTGGAVFDYVSGALTRAPRWMTSNYLEWLGRLIIEPKRLWRRYLIGIPLFFFRMLKYKLISVNSIGNGN